METKTWTSLWLEFCFASVFSLVSDCPFSLFFLPCQTGFFFLPYVEFYGRTRSIPGTYQVYTRYVPGTYQVHTRYTRYIPGRGGVTFLDPRSVGWGHSQRGGSLFQTPVQWFGVTRARVTPCSLAVLTPLEPPEPFPILTSSNFVRKRVSSCKGVKTRATVDRS